MRTNALQRTATIDRTTGETTVSLQLNLDGTGKTEIATGVGFLDHMLTLFASHGMFDLIVQAQGDLQVDEHHTAEDVCLCLGKAIDQALGDRRGIVRTAHAYVPMDETLGFVALDLSGRPYCVFHADFATPRVGQLSTDLIEHLFESPVLTSRQLTERYEISQSSAQTVIRFLEGECVLRETTGRKRDRVYLADQIAATVGN